MAFHLLALELWGRLYVHGEDPDVMAERLLTLAGDATPGAGPAPAATARRGAIEPEAAR